MILDVNGDETVADPDAERIRTALHGLDGDEFAILSKGDQDYVQTYHNADGTFLLEYRTGSADEHYAVNGTEVTVEDVVNAFLGFIEGDDSWKDAWTWEQLRFDEEE